MRDINNSNLVLKSFVIKDTLSDAAFSNNDYVKQFPFIRFCASVQMRFPIWNDKNGNGRNDVSVAIGSVCIIDTKPHPNFDVDDRNNLKDCVASMTERIWKQSSCIRELIHSGDIGLHNKNEDDQDSIDFPDYSSAESGDGNVIEMDKSFWEEWAAPGVHTPLTSRSRSRTASTSRESDGLPRDGLDKTNGSHSAELAMSSNNARTLEKEQDKDACKLPIPVPVSVPVHKPVASSNSKMDILSPIHFRYSISGNFSKTPTQIYGTPLRGSPRLSPKGVDAESSINKTCLPSRFSEDSCSISVDYDSDADKTDHRSHIKVLLMEDSILVQKILTRLFAQHGCEVKIAKNGKIGLEFLKTEDFDIAFVDFFMPIQDGVTTMRLYKEYLTQLRGKPDYKFGSIYNDSMILVGISDVASDGDKSAASYNDMHVFCSKPLDPELLGIILDARRNSISLDDALTQITAGTVELMKRKATLVTAMGQLSTNTVGNASERPSGIMTETMSEDQDNDSRMHLNQRIRKKPRAPSDSGGKKRVPMLSWWRRITENFKGDVKVNPAATVTAPKPVRQKTMRPPPPRDVTHSTKRPRVLVVDDSVLIQKLLKRLFVTNGCDVTIASDGVEGLDYLKKKEFDIAFLDFCMPKQDGVTTLGLFATHIEEEQQWVNKGYISGDKKKVCNINTLLVGMSDNLTSDKTESVFENNNMHFYCSKPISNDLLMIVLMAVKSHDSVDDMLVYIEQNVTKVLVASKKKMKNLS